MAAADNAYSRAVTAAKVILPLIALAILSVLFLFARPAPDGEPLRYVKQDVVEMAEDQGLGTATYSAVTPEGTQVSLSASSFRPDREIDKLTHGQDLTARLITPDGLRYDISAGRGRLDETSMRTTLEDTVLITTSSGYELSTQAADIAADFSSLVTRSTVTATGPVGTLEAGKLEIATSPESGEDSRMLFTGGVHLIYMPQNGVE